MHTCHIGRHPCSCGGDISPVISITEPAGCVCCIGALCDHGIEFGANCPACATEGFVPEPDAAVKSLNGGW